MFPYKTEAIADKRTTNPLQSEEKKARTYFKSDWTCFKANNSVSPIGHRSSQTRVPIKNCRNGQENRTKFNRPCAADRRRSPQTPGANISICLRRARDIAQTYRR